MTSHHFGRRRLLGSAASIGFLGVVNTRHAKADLTDISQKQVAQPIPLSDVRLLPSPWLTAVESNRRYLLSLDPDRLLHNFRTLAGLPAKGKIYGGWESDTIAGHTLGHYLSAIALMHAQTGDEECRRRVAYIVDELALVQHKQGDGYVAGFTRKGAEGKIEDGKLIFAEIEKGDIRSGGFDLNGAWSPLYNVHKTFAGLLDAQTYCGNQKALKVALRFAEFFENFYSKLTDAQLQKVLLCEYGGLNESFAELGARTGDAKWVALGKRTYDNAVLGPLVAGKDDLPNHHANTQIPKIIGLARISELSDTPEFSGGSRFFWDRVTGHHSFVIGGNADREYFFEPDTTSQHLTEQTCEHCNSYNMLKLTRKLYSWSPDADYFDYYERTHLNHILAAHDPSDGMFTYMTPMITAGVRGWSSPTDDFWCCVGTGMESHAKHGDSIWWENQDGLAVNLYIPSTVLWRKKDVGFSLETRYPYAGTISLKVTHAARPEHFSLYLRVPKWVSGEVQLSVNGESVEPTISKSYLLVDREWKAGDVVTLSLPMALRTESPIEDKRLVTLARGPLLLAADLAPASGDYDAISPALVTENILQDLKAVPNRDMVFQTTQSGRPAQLTFVPFFSQYKRRSALYLECFSADEWRTEEKRFVETQRRLKDIAARTVDVIHLGEMQQEHDHGLTAEESWPVVYRGRNGRDVRRGGFAQFTLGVKPGPMILETTMWEKDVDRSKGFRVLVDGTLLADGNVDGLPDRGFVDLSVDIPENLTQGKKKVTVRIEPASGHSAGPFFGVRIFARNKGQTL